MMDLEQLKLVMQTLQGLGETAKTGFIWWLLVEGVLPRLIWALGMGGALGLVYYLASLMYRKDRLEASESAARKAIADIRRTVGLYHYMNLKEDIEPDRYTRTHCEETAAAVVRLANALSERIESEKAGKTSVGS